MARILVTGAGGMLAADLLPLLQERDHRVVAKARKDLDITDPDAIQATFEKARPEIVINCAAFTQVDACETEKEACHKVNGDGPGNLAKACDAADALLAHISTDYVFDGQATEPYVEDHPTAPQSEYGRSKLAGELAVQEHAANHVIIRASGLYGVGGKCFPKTMAALFAKGVEPKVVADQVTAPTFTADFAAGIAHLIDEDRQGIYHLANEGHCTWNEFAKAIAEELGHDPAIVGETTTAEYGAPAPRPAYSVFNIEKFVDATGHRPRHWREALKAFLRDLSVEEQAGKPR